MTTVTVRSQLGAMLEREEGRKACAYKDSRGYDTIGIGHLVDVRMKGAGLPDFIIDMLRDYDIDQAFRQLDQSLPWWRNEPMLVQVALADMTFQLGIEGVLGFHNMLAALQVGDYPRAHTEALASDWHKQTSARCERVANLFLSVGATL